MVSKILIYCALSACACGVEMEIGNMIDLFRNYGLLTRIFPIDANHDEFMQIEFSENVFDKRTSKSVSNMEPLPNSGSWHVELHENIGNVLRSILQDYKIDFVENVEKAFASSYSRKSIAGFFGISHLYLLDYHCYGLLKYRKTVSHFELLDTAIENPMLDTKILDAITNISSGDTQGVLRFISKFGSHYVNSFSIGELLYQIFAIPQSRYTCLTQLKKIQNFDDMLKCANASEIHASQIKSLTNDVELEERLNDQYRKNSKQKFPNLFLMKQDSDFALHLGRLQNLVITSFNLRNVAEIVGEPKSAFFREVISNHMTLRELFLNLF